jgi:hypothetical protein
MEEEKEFKDIKLGSSFAYEGVIYECRPAYTCEGCIFNPGDDCYGCCKPKFFGHCSALNRVDNRDVIFVEIGKEKPSVPKTEFALNEEFQCGLKRLKCVKSKNPVIEYSDDRCVGCFFFECGSCYSSSGIAGECFSSERIDGNDVIFVEVEPKD